MDLTTLRNLIFSYAISLELDLVGFSEIGVSPIENLPELKYAVSIAVKLPDAVLKTIENKPTIAYFHEYRTANAFLDNCSFKISRFIEKQGYLAFPIGASQSLPESDYEALFSHKHAARLAGLGFIGKSGLFINEKYGSKIRLATVLTNLPLKSKNPIIKNGCGTCDKCVKACPAGAISGTIYTEGMRREEFFFADKCSHHMKTYKDIGRGAVCGICIKACPYNKL
jgi:epoxyqueuosine reductase QueG